MTEILKIIGVTLAGIFLLTGLMFAALHPLSKAMCVRQWPEKFKPAFVLGAGCMIETKDGRIPAKNYRAL
jgi:hypothetical protein